MYSIIKHLILSLFLFVFSSFNAQHIEGVITNLEGQPLPFATVYIKNTTYGVAANSYGEYFIELQTGKHQLVFSYVGYTSFQKEINVTANSKSYNIQLSPSAEELLEMEIVSNTKNKAKEIIRSVKNNKNNFQ